MTENQAFEILKKAGGARAAKLVLRAILKKRENRKKARDLSLFSVSIAARQLKRAAPVAKIIHEKWFYGLQFYTNRWTLDPRPDSETLVQAVLDNHRRACIGGDASRILDLGTGTGCLIAAIAKNLPGMTGVGIDKSWHACRIARRNMKILGLGDRVRIIKGDFKNIENSRGGRPELFDVIVSNPPYIALGDSVDVGAKHDPALALYAGRDGLDAYRAIAAIARKLLKPAGKIFLEIGAGQGRAVREIFRNYRFVESFNDLAGIERILEFALVSERRMNTGGFGRMKWH